MHCSRHITITLAGLLFAALLPLGGCSPTDAPVAPNIVVIFTDDQGYRDVGLYDSEYTTPNIDRIGREGATFTDFYVSSPTCTPSRYSLLTGQYPQRSADFLVRPLAVRDSARGLRPQATTLAELLGQKGYRTTLLGKWHLGHGRKTFFPTRHGFDSFYGFTTGLIDYFTLQTGNVPAWYEDERPVEPKGYATEVITDRAVRFVDDHTSSQPFFLLLSYNAPHYGLTWSEKANTNQMVLQPKEDDLARVAHIDDPERRKYAAMVKALDRGIGRVLQALERSGFDENTWVMFISDNGGDPKYRDYDFGGRNDPLRGGKRQLWEGGIRVPALMKWPGRIPSGTVIEQPLSTMDLFPTIARIVDADVSELTLDGRDISGVLFDGQTLDRSLFWTYEGSHAYRRGRWKYLERAANSFLGHEATPPMLFNLESDPGEQHDLADKYPDILEQLVTQHRRQLERLPRSEEASDAE